MIKATDFKPDRYVYVQTRSAPAARRFFGVPDATPVRFHRFDPRTGMAEWRVDTAGVTIGSDPWQIEP